MYSKLLSKIVVVIFIPIQLIAYDFSFQKDDILLKLDFDNTQIKEIKFDIKINGQKNGILSYEDVVALIMFDVNDQMNKLK